MRKLIATLAAALAVVGVGVATHTAISDAPADAMIVFDYGARMTGPSGGVYLMDGYVVNG